MKHALAVTVEPFKFSSRQGGLAYELSQSGCKKGRVHHRPAYKVLPVGINIWVLFDLHFQIGFDDDTFCFHFFQSLGGRVGSHAFAQSFYDGNFVSGSRRIDRCRLDAVIGGNTINNELFDTVFLQDLGSFLFWRRHRPETRNNCHTFYPYLFLRWLRNRLLSIKTLAFSVP